MLKLARWLRTVRQNCSTSLPTTFRSCKWTIASLASFTCEGCGFRPISELDRKPTPLVYNAMGRMAFMCNSVIWPQSEKHRIGPKMVSEAISNFKIFLGGSMPADSLGYSVFARTLPTWPLQIGWLWPWNAHPCNSATHKVEPYLWVLCVERIRTMMCQLIPMVHNYFCTYYRRTGFQENNSEYILSYRLSSLIKIASEWVYTYIVLQLQ